ncbi:helicase-associated domain-containing protein [Acidipropionibacterium jensenii]|uniref:helicase-associated domain-containing protein n=1 Tax=Acidipropionibacterium jensenii TaxID=1749 RepID=UPI0026479E00|nr:helicase-associated domain-containing protein [Acidipropionibacterium jensenii]MDN6791557.1 helicase-associated domain-containing protein [Acidipropionibacterium jensenii]
MSGTITLASVIRGMDTDAMTQLLSLRPDLASPPPRSLAEMAERASTQASVRAALDGLDSWQYRVVLAIAALGDVSRDDLAGHLLDAASGDRTTATAEQTSEGAGEHSGTPHSVGLPSRRDLDEAVDHLEDLALVLPEEDQFHLVSAAASVLGPSPAGLAPESGQPLTAAEVAERLDAAGPTVLPVLHRLMWSPSGHVPHARRAVSPETATSPIDLALAHRLLHPVDDETVVLPREVSLVLRKGRLFQNPVSARPPAWPSPHPAARTDSAALGTALEAISSMSALLEAVETITPARLASGGMAKRDATRALARVAHGDTGWWYLTVAVSANLIAADSRGWLPTTTADKWRQDELWTQWQVLRDAWLAIPQTPGELSNTLDAPAPATARAWRQQVLNELRTAEPGTPVDPELVIARIAWRHPVWPVLEAAPVLRATTEECQVLGLTALGARSGLVDATEDPGMPQRQESVILQSDLTAVAPGPLTPGLAADLALLADRESTGVAGVRRFTRTSLRRALDAGWSGDQVREWWRLHSMSEVPQGLLVLLDDVVRDHGRVSVAATGSVLEVDDPSLMETLLRSSAAEGLGLRRLAPTVLAAQADPDVVLAALRDMGLSPVARDAHGDIFNAPAPARARTADHGGPGLPPGPRSDPKAVAESLASLPTFNDSRHLLAILHRAQADGTWLEVTWVRDDGTTTSETLKVMALAKGAMRCVRRGGGGIVIIPVPRVSAARAMAQ